MSSQSNTEIVKRIYDAAGRGEAESVLDLFTDDVDWNMPGVAPYAGRRSGREQVKQFFADLNQAISIDDMDARAFVSEGDRVIVLGYERATVKETGRHFEQEWAHAFTLRGGRIAAVHLYEDTHAQAAAFGESNREREALTGPMGVTHPAYSGRPNRDF